MHEMSLCEGVRRIIDEQAAVHGFSAVRVVRLEVGRFAGVEKDALAFAFDVVMQGGPAEGARLELIDLPGAALCYDCGQQVELEHRLAPCPACGGGRLMPQGGDEMRIKDLEVI
ncbi:hydrogenase maturation nickel metallochaperone HypA [Pannonibacter sp. SL95]|jgi:hydrogenase nickel incorporation protein HypA/HybF|uniref:hydrogenase maturation nickel metallochaperone HypA n=1 Tax=Pannonibacter sp. SL95 TaxID=2995153 RepID=UPI0022740431|nr:hydrogenase maturation nickel metallochaperone HypA [Pannonibacter sp. SL95]MCY1705147.1 hydrogenase maturation nickel metallochaperone HypA [Pannonibacter sp. SL95]